MKIFKEFFKVITEEHNFINLFWFNFHKVDEGVYRSAQITPWRLKKIIQKYNIKTIINLRGNKQNYLYKREKEICEKLGVEYYTFSISSRMPEELSKEKLQELINLLKNSKKPLLFHCKAGADRTGFVSVLWHIINGKNKQFAINKELRLRYAYLPFSKAGKIKYLFEMYDGKSDFVEWFEENKHKLKEFKPSKLGSYIYDNILKRE